MPTIQQLDVVNTAAVETGAVRFGADAPGLYVRGDEARMLAFDVAVVLGFISNCHSTNANALQVAIHNLEKLHDLIRQDVVRVQSPSSAGEAGPGGPGAGGNA